MVHSGDLARSACSLNIDAALEVGSHGRHFVSLRQPCMSAASPLYFIFFLFSIDTFQSLYRIRCCRGPVRTRLPWILMGSYVLLLATSGLYVENSRQSRRVVVHRRSSVYCYLLPGSRISIFWILRSNMNSAVGRVLCHSFPSYLEHYPQMLGHRTADGITY